MKTLMIAGALALAGLGLAGTAAADCVNTPVGLFTYDNLSVCALESYSYSIPPYYEYNSLTPASASFYGYNPSPYEYNSLSLYTQQYQSEDCWSSPCGANGGTYGGLSLYQYDGSGYTNLGVGFGQYYGDYSWGNYGGTYASVYYSAPGEYTNVYFNQYNYNGSCNEQLVIYDSSGVTEIIPYGPCTVEVPQLPALPAL